MTTDTDTRSALHAAPADSGPSRAPSVPHLDPFVESVAQGLRGARARTGLSEQEVVAVLAEGGLVITAARLRGWERTGVIRIDVASRLADVYGITIDALAGRRAYRSRHQRGPEPGG